VVSFGYDFLDHPLTGIFPSELVVIGGETGSGKTTFATNIVYKASRRGIRSCIFALEDRLEDYGIKALYFRIGQIRKQEEGEHTLNYPWNDFRRNTLLTDPTFVHYLNLAKEELKNENIEFVDVDKMMNIDLLEQLIEHQVKQGVKLFLVDHLHYFQLGAKETSKADYIESVMLRIKSLQNRTGARVLLVVHYRKLNKQEPDLDSFKDSISIVQNANYVINIWRKRSENDFSKDDLGEGLIPTTFSIPKSRNPNGETKFDRYFDQRIGDYREDIDVVKEVKEKREKTLKERSEETSARYMRLEESSENDNQNVENESADVKRIREMFNNKPYNDD
jgi:replicative DNA helicase